MDTRTWTIAELAREFGVTARTLRFYEEHGLLEPERRGMQRVFHSGYLATALCLDARAVGAPQPVLQLLIYPDVDATNRSESMVTMDAFIGLEQVTELHAAHCGDQLLNPRASPIHAADHRGLAPAFILAASHDPFVDQGRAYAAVLRAAGVPVEYAGDQGTIHAFVSMGGAVNVATSAGAAAAAAVAASCAGAG